ncbi:MAG: nucleotide pyrophosphatase/phosphodiesterase family protein [Cyanobacteria bacterium J06607_10]
MQKTVVINVVGLSDRLIGEYTPNLKRWRDRGQQVNIQPQLPAVTCSMQATYLTGKPPSEHGIVGNGWYFRDECEVKFWRQSNRLVQSPKIWEVARQRDPSFTCTNLFWWYNMHSTADFTVTPRPMYPADGRKIPDIYTQPAALREQLNSALGQFPLFKFWGPATDISSSRWIAESAKWIESVHSSTLTLIYLPHLDYCLQKKGARPDQIAADLGEIDAVCGSLIDYYEARGTEVVVLSEYGVTPVSQPVHINRVLREAGLLCVREELGKELLDVGASEAFAVADHQVAHVYVRDAEKVEQVRSLIASVPGVAQVLGEAGKQAHQLNHVRSGELIAIAKPEAWFTYYYWLNDRHAPDFATTVDIHRKPGYDPAELFINPDIRWPTLKIARTLLQKKMGFRTLLDVIPLDASLVKGSHGHRPQNSLDWPLLITQSTDLLTHAQINSTDVFQLLLNHIFRDSDTSAFCHPVCTESGIDKAYLDA